MLNERRLYPRFNIEWPVAITTDKGEKIAATALNIAMSGLQLGCDHDEALSIVPQGEQITPAHNLEINISINLPLANNSTADVSTRCKVVVLRRMAKDEYRVGVEFIDLSEENELQLRQYMEERLHGKQ